MPLNPKAFIKKTLFSESIDQKPTRDGFGHGLVEAGDANDQVVALCCDLVESTRTQWFAEKYPERFIEVGVAEQNAVGMAAGMALSGKVAFVTSYATFCPGRAWDQVRVSVCYQNANVKVIGSHAGMSVGPDGATHQALEDIASTRVLPNMVVMNPCDEEEARKMTIAAAQHIGPVYIRLARADSPVFTSNKTPFKIGKANVLWSAKKKPKATIIATGPLVHEALVAARDLEKANIEVEVINCHTIKPLDEKTILAAVKKSNHVVTVEEHQVNGGLGGAIAELLAKYHPAPIEMIAVQDHFGESGEPHELWEKYGLVAKNISMAVKKVIKR